MVSLREQMSQLKNAKKAVVDFDTSFATCVNKKVQSALNAESTALIETVYIYENANGTLRLQAYIVRCFENAKGKEIELDDINQLSKVSYFFSPIESEAMKALMKAEGFTHVKDDEHNYHEAPKGKVVSAIGKTMRYVTEDNVEKVSRYIDANNVMVIDKH